jgi:hypothetical protein
MGSGPAECAHSCGEEPATGREQPAQVISAIGRFLDGD